MVFQELPNLAHTLPWGNALPKDGTVTVHEIHQDCVLELPEKAVLLASSPKTRVEVWAYQNHVLCIQGKHSALHLPLAFADMKIQGYFAPSMKGVVLRYVLAMVLPCYSCRVSCSAKV